MRFNVLLPYSALSVLEGSCLLLVAQYEYSQYC
jgi:hypothetical protein